MIRSFRHRGLKRFYERDDASKLPRQFEERIRDILTALDHATEPVDMDHAGFGLHPLRANRRGEWAVTVTRNWRITWRFDGSDVIDVNYEDYH